jgi:hypothetical protein
VARLNLDDFFFGDPRIDFLANLCGETKHATRGRIISLWHDCLHRLEDVRDSDEIDLMTGWFDPDKGAMADMLVRVKLAEKTGDGRYRIRGMADRMGWLEKKRAAAHVGGKASAEGRPRDEKGRLLSSDRSVTQASAGPDPSKTQASSSEHLPPSSPLALAPVLAPAPVPKKIQIQGELTDLDQNQFKILKSTWLECLEHYGGKRDLIPGEDIRLVRGMQAKGFEAVSLAILGMRHEPAGDGFKPSRHVSLVRLFDPQKFDRFVTLGAQARTQIQEREEQRRARQQALERFQSADPATESGDPVDREKIRALISGALGVKIGPGGAA